MKDSLCPVHKFNNLIPSFFLHCKEQNSTFLFFLMDLDNLSKRLLCPLCSFEIIKKHKKIIVELVARWAYDALNCPVHSQVVSSPKHQRDGSLVPMVSGQLSKVESLVIAFSRLVPIFPFLKIHAGVLLQRCGSVFGGLPPLTSRDFNTSQDLQSNFTSQLFTSSQDQVFKNNLVVQG